MALTSASRADARFARNTGRDALPIEDGIDDFLPAAFVPRH
jgi:hypothetical protein